jgi:hypothetical protein
MMQGRKILVLFDVLKDFTSSQRRFIMRALEDLIHSMGESGVCPPPNIVEVIR